MDLHQKNQRMLTKEIINKQIPTLKSTDTGEYALSLMEDLKTKHLPVNDNGTYSFLLSEKDIFQMGNTENTIAGLSIFAPCVSLNSPLLDALHIIAKDKLSLLPVINEEGIYLGAITLDLLIEKMDDITNAGSHGSIIAIEINTLDYDFSNIARLAESNNAKILSLFTYPVPDTDKMTILLKIDLEDASPLLRSLERFNFHVIYYSQKDGIVDEILKKRLDELLFYLKM